MILRWKYLAGPLTERKLRADLGLAVVFAELGDCLEAWQEALRGWNVIESKVVKEWQREARLEGEREGERKGKADAILEVLEDLVGKPPSELAAAVRAVTDQTRLRHLLTLAARAASIEQFRQDAGL